MSRGLMAPERWAAIVSIAGALFPEPPTHRTIYKDVWGFPANIDHWKATAPMALMGSIEKAHVPPIFLHCGKSDLDRFLDMTMAANERLRSLGVEPELVLTEGGHGWTTWRGINERWLVWLDGALLKSRR
jgi:S-formylglutathione hydrolase FrmB